MISSGEFFFSLHEQKTMTVWPDVDSTELVRIYVKGWKTRHDV